LYDKRSRSQLIRTPSGPASELDDLHQAWRATNAILLSAPDSKAWGLHEFIAADPDGNVFRVFYDFATPEREGASVTAL
jgi:hypothetical protein